MKKNPVTPPADSGTGSAIPELIAHEWSPEGVCLNPETIRRDAGKGRWFDVSLGCQPDGTWRYGWGIATGTGGATLSGCPTMTGAAGTQPEGRSTNRLPAATRAAKATARMPPVEPSVATHIRFILGTSEKLFFHLRHFF